MIARFRFGTVEAFTGRRDIVANKRVTNEHYGEWNKVVKSQMNALLVWEYVMFIVSCFIAYNVFNVADGAVVVFKIA